MNTSSNQLVAYLKTLVPENIGLLDRIKVVYRPVICPLDELLNLLPANAGVFDIGCGNGSFLALVSKFCSPRKIGGIEISKTLVENANAVLGKTATAAAVDIRIYDGHTLPDFISEYDFVYMTDVFHHIPPSIQQHMIMQLYQKMRAGSIFVMKDIDAGKWPWFYFNKLHDWVAAGEIGNEISAMQMKNLLEAAGFTIKSSSYKRMFWYPHYTFVCEKK